MCERSGWVPSSVPNPYRDFTWWDTGVPQPTSGLQVEGNKAQTEAPRLVGPRGRPLPRRVHGFGFQAVMRDTED